MPESVECTVRVFFEDVPTGQNGRVCLRVSGAVLSDGEGGEKLCHLAQAVTSVRAVCGTACAEWHPCPAGDRASFDGCDLRMTLPAATATAAAAAAAASEDSAGRPDYTVTLTLSSQPAVFCVPEELRDVLGLTRPVDSKVHVSARLWAYVLHHNLRDPDDKHTVVLDGPLKRALGSAAATLPVKDLTATLDAVLTPVPPVVLTVPSGPGLTCYDIASFLPWTGFGGIDVGADLLPEGVATASALGPQVAQLDERIGDLLRGIREARAKRTFLETFAENPTGTARDVVASVLRDAEVVRLDQDLAASVALCAGARHWRRSEPYSMTQKVPEAVCKAVYLMNQKWADKQKHQNQNQHQHHGQHQQSSNKRQRN
jgi:hypothetical protein